MQRAYKILQPTDSGVVSNPPEENYRKTDDSFKEELKEELVELFKKHKAPQPWWKTLGIILGIMGGIITLCGLLCGAVYKIANIEGNILRTEASVNVVDKKLADSVTEIKGSVTEIKGDINSIEGRVHSIDKKTAVIESQTAGLYSSLIEKPKKKE